MAKLKNKIENALNEGRILILGGQVLIGFYFRAFFEPGFPKLPRYAQLIEIATLGLMLVGLGLLIWPAAYHRIVYKGELTASFHRFVNGVLAIALLPFALSVGTFAYFPFERVFGTKAGVVAGALTAFIALFFWYGLEMYRRGRLQKSVSPHAVFHPGEHKMQDEEQQSELSEKIKEVLIEARMVLPGAQALLGFQFITVFMDRFQQIPRGLKILHVASLLSVAICTVLLITPAAYHRIVEAGEESEDLHDFASRVLLAAMVFLGLGVCGDFAVVMIQGTGAVRASIVVAVLLLAFYFALWFGWTTYRRAHRPA
jgi:hypothetical protein